MVTVRWYPANSDEKRDCCNIRFASLSHGEGRNRRLQQSFSRRNRYVWFIYVKRTVPLERSGAPAGVHTLLYGGGKSPSCCLANPAAVARVCCRRDLEFYKLRSIHTLCFTILSFVCLLCNFHVLIIQDKCVQSLMSF